MAGNYQNHFHPVSAHAHTINVISGQVREGPALNEENDGDVSGLLACSDTLFFTVYHYPEINVATSTDLYSAPLPDLKAPTKLAKEESEIKLGGCAE